MSDQPPSPDDLKDVRLDHVETAASKADMKMVLKCEKCGETEDWPRCCGVPVEYVEESGMLKCNAVDCPVGEKPVPEHCGQKMKPIITKA